jgi:uncharacterized protein YegL
MDNHLLNAAEFADNPEARCPVALLLDTSGSMQGRPIQELNEALRLFSQDLKRDPLASLRVELAVVAFGGQVRALDVAGEESHQIVPVTPRSLLAPRRPTPEVPFDAARAFITVDRFQPPFLEARGETPMGAAVMRTLGLLRDRKALLKLNGLDYYRPWLFVITDGKPTDEGEWQRAAQAVRQEEARKGLTFFGVGTQGANLDTLAQFSAGRRPLRLQGLAFAELFTWLSKSLSLLAGSQVGDQIPLPEVGNWGQIDTSSG